MDLTVLTPPDTEPVALVDAKGYMRVTSSSEDALIQQLVTTARLRVEETTGYAIGGQTRRLVIDGWPSDGVLEIPAPPLLSVETVETRASDGTFDELVEGTDYDVVLGDPGAVCLRGAVPSSYGYPASVRVSFTCGLGPTEEGAPPIPENLLLAIKSLALHFFDHRGPVEHGQVTSVPNTYEFLTASHRYRWRPLLP